MSTPKIPPTPPNFNPIPEKPSSKNVSRPSNDFKEIVEKKKKPDEKQKIESKEVEEGNEDLEGLKEELGIGRREEGKDKRTGEEFRQEGKSKRTGEEFGRGERAGKGEKAPSEAPTKGQTTVTPKQETGASKIKGQQPETDVDDQFDEFESGLGDEGFYPEKGRIGKKDLFSLLEDHIPEKPVKGKTSSEEEVKIGSEGLSTSDLTRQSMEGKLEGISSVKGESSGVQSSQNLTRAETWTMVERLVEKIVMELKTSGQTEITITLKEPPMFQGSQIRIVEQTSLAKNEFNIAFENLSPDALRLIEIETQKGTLKEALEKKGYVLHNISTNLETEKATPKFEESRGGREQGQEREGGGGGGRGGRGDRDKEERDRR